MRMRESVHVNDQIWFRIPFTVYWLGRLGGYPGLGLCLWRKDWSPRMNNYYWDVV